MFRPNIKLIFCVPLTVFFMSCAHKASVSKSNVQAHSVSNRPTKSLVISSPLADEQKRESHLMQELTGKTQDVNVSANLKAKPLSFHHFSAGKKMASRHNYIMAIKHFNTVIKKYPASEEYKLALVEKSKIYKEMGLVEPAQLNMKLANEPRRILQKKQISKNQGTSTLKK